MQIIDKIKKAKNKFDFARIYFSLVNDYSNTDKVFKLIDNVRNNLTPQMREVLTTKLAEQPQNQQMFKERYLAPKYRIEDLAHKEVGTLGYAYYRHMQDNHFDLNFFPPIEPTDNFLYYILRIGQTHDIWHVVTGFKTNLAGEVGLQAFYAGQSLSPINFVIVSGGILAAARKPDEAVEVMESAKTGWDNGRAAKHLFPIKWEELWDRSLEDIRAEYNIKPASTLYDFERAKVAATN